MIKLIATCITKEQQQVCERMGIEVMQNYACSYGEIVPGCVTDYSVHCFNSASLDVLSSLGVKRATLHPELKLAQIRDIKKCIETEVVIYGKLTLMKLGNPIKNGALIDRMDKIFYVHEGMLYNSVPIFMADRLYEIEKSGVTTGRMMFTTENAAQTSGIIESYKNRVMMKMDFTRGKY